MKQFSSLKDLPHYPVMLDEVVKVCAPEKGGLFLDCTFGSGGYTNAILSFPKTKVIAVDRDITTKKYANLTKRKFKNRFNFYNLKFSEINKAFNKNTQFDTIIFDLGLSSMQIKDLKRGFSFKSTFSPDMRMGLNNISGEYIINNLNITELTKIFKLFGEEQEGFYIAKNIINYRKKKNINSIPELVKIIKNSKSKNFKKGINISTKTFQAIRIFVNSEISELIEGLINASNVLKKNGKIIVVSFHSIEDKIVKFFFSNFSESKPKGSRYYPDTIQNKILFLKYKNKILTPTQKEIQINPSSRSAKLRYAIRSENDFFYPIDLKKKFSTYLEVEKINV